jgi:hypothetical protein
MRFDEILKTNSKGQLISECIYEVIVSPKCQPKIIQISVLPSQEKNLENVWLAFWKKR